MASYFEKNKIETIEAELTPKATVTSLSFWLFMIIAVIVVIFRIIEQSDELSNEESFFQRLKKPRFLLNKYVWNFMWTLVILLNAYATYRMIVISRRGEAKRLISAMFLLEMLHLILWTLTFFDYQNIRNAFYIGLIAIIAAVVQLSTTILVDKISAILYLITIIWIIYVMVTNFQIMELNPWLKEVDE